MLQLAQGAYTDAQVRDLLHAATGSRQVQFRYALLNKYDVEIGTLTTVESGSVRLDTEADISRTARFNLAENEADDIDWLSDRIKPYFRLRAGSDWLEWPLGVFILSSPGRRSASGRITRSVEAYDKGVILSEDRFTGRYLIAASTLYTDAIDTILDAAGLWKVNITPSAATLAVPKEFEIGTSKLEAVNALLTEINYSPLYIDAEGYAICEPYVLPTAREASYTYRTDHLSIIRDGALQEEDLFAVPNVWVVAASNPEQAAVTSTYTNDRATSPSSTINRGRNIVDFRRIDAIYNQATLDAYVQRLAYEASQVYGRLVFASATMPHHGYGDILFIEHDDLDLATKYREIAWEMDLAPGGQMTHECRRVIRI